MQDSTLSPVPHVRDLAGPEDVANLTADQAEASRRVRAIIDAHDRTEAAYGSECKLLADFFIDGHADHMTRADGRPIPANRRQRYFA